MEECAFVQVFASRLHFAALLAELEVKHGMLAVLQRDLFGVLSRNCQCRYPRLCPPWGSWMEMKVKIVRTKQAQLEWKKHLGRSQRVGAYAYVQLARWIAEKEGNCENLHQNEEGQCVDVHARDQHDEMWKE